MTLSPFRTHYFSAPRFTKTFGGSFVRFQFEFLFLFFLAHDPYHQSFLNEPFPEELLIMSTFIIQS
jgi:hypothetical protein